MNPSASAVAEVLERHRRILLFGEPGVGKSTLVTNLACKLAERGHSCQCVSGDPGSPAFGPPGAVSLASWSDAKWQLITLEPVCTLDAARYRLPLIRALERLMANADAQATILFDPPGLVRGAAAAELLLSLCECVEVDAIIVLTRNERETPLRDELLASGAQIYSLAAAEEAKRPVKRERERYRTRQWNQFLLHACEDVVDLDDLRVIGMPPTGEQWRGRQVALLKDG
ncbi:MAG: Clp1/GlmU family protein, partial [Pseudomonadales bacterium]